MEEVGRKRYLSETPSIGWEAKTLGAKRRISSSEIATVPGTLDVMEVLFSAVLMLVDLVGWFCDRSIRRGFGSCRSFFDVRFRSRKYAGHIFRAESEALAERLGRRPEGARAVSSSETG